MNNHFTHTTHPPGSWLAALAGSLVLWSIAYAQAPAPAASPPADHGATGLPIAGRGRLKRLLLNDSDNTVALRQLAISYVGARLASATQPAEPGREPSPRMVAANVGPVTRPIGPK